MQLTSSVGIFTDVRKQTVYTLAAIELLNSINSCYTWRFRFIGTFYVDTIVIKQTKLSKFAKMMKWHINSGK